MKKTKGLDSMLMKINVIVDEYNNSHRFKKIYVKTLMCGANYSVIVSFEEAKDKYAYEDLKRWQKFFREKDVMHWRNVDEESKIFQSLESLHGPLVSAEKYINDILKMKSVSTD